MWRTMWTYIIIAVGSVVIAAVDVFLAKDATPGNTWSEAIKTWGQNTMFIPYLYGVLGGHFFGPYGNVFGWETPYKLSVLTFIGIVLVIAGVAIRYNHISMHGALPLAVLLFGTACGAIIWGFKI